MITSMTWAPPDISYDAPPATTSCDPAMRVQCELDAELEKPSSGGDWNGYGVPASYVDPNIGPHDVNSLFNNVFGANH